MRLAPDCPRSFSLAPARPNFHWGSIPFLCSTVLASASLSPLSIHRIAYKYSWMKRVKGTPRRCKLIQSGMFDTLLSSGRRPLSGHSIQDALRAFLPPIKNDDARLDFYAVYKKEATEYDTDYVKKYDEDLNTTLIFVCRASFNPASYLTRSHRRVCSLPSVPPLSSIFTRNSNPTQTINLQPSSAQSFSPSTSLLSQTKPPPFHPPRKIHPAKSSPSLGSCTRVS